MRRWVGLGLSAAALVAALSASRAPEGAIYAASPMPARAPEPAWRAPIEVANGPAYQGAWRQNDSEFHYVDDPTVAAGEGGRIAVAWADHNRRDVFFRLYDRDGAALLDAPVNVSRDATIFSWLPRIAMPARDTNLVYVAWQELIFAAGGSHGGDIFFARSTDGGKSFDTPANLSGSIAGDGKGRVSPQVWDNGSLDVAAGPGEEIHVAWTEYEGALWYRRSTDTGRTFSERVRIAGDGTSPARAPSLAAGAGGEVHLAWTVREGASRGIRVATSQDRGATFERPDAVGARDGRADAPKIGVDGRGTVHLVFAAPLEDEPSRVLYARKARTAVTFEQPRQIAGGDGAVPSGYPSVAIGEADDVYIVWERFPPIVGRARGLGFAFSRDAGRTISSPSVVPGTGETSLGVNGGLQGLLMRKLAVTDDGTIVVVNSSFSAGTISRVRLILGRWDGDAWHRERENRYGTPAKAPKTPNSRASGGSV